LYTYKAAKQVYKMAKQTCFNDAQLSRYLEGVRFGASEAMSKRYQMGLVQEKSRFPVAILAEN
jgi:hypothetical protein